MIAKIHKGRGFRGLLEYALRESKGYLLDTNMGGDTPHSLSREFGQIRALHPTTKPVFHVSIALSPNDRLTDEQWKETAERYVCDMGFGACQYVVAKHTDAPHPHIHIIINRVALDGTLVSDSKDYQRQERIMRHLEKEYGLKPVSPSRESQRRRATKGELERALRTGTPSTKMLLQKMIDLVLAGKPDLPGFIARLDALGVQTRPNMAKTGRISGIRFTLDAITMKGSDLGRGYTWAGLQKRGLSHEQIRYAGERHGRTHQEIAAGDRTRKGERRGKEPLIPGNGSSGGSPGADPCAAGNSQRRYGQEYAGDTERFAEYLQHGQRNPEKCPPPGGRSEVGAALLAAGGARDGNPLERTHPESAPARERGQMDIPVSDGHNCEHAVGGLIALAAARLRHYHEQSGTDMEQAGRDGGENGRNRRERRQEIDAPPKRQEKERGR